MKKFIVSIEETVVQEFEIIADNADDVLHLAIEQYRNGKLVLESGEPQFKQISVVYPNKDISEWIEF